jgi:protein-disulfide isomerase
VTTWIAFFTTYTSHSNRPVHKNRLHSIGDRGQALRPWSFICGAWLTVASSAYCVPQQPSDRTARDNGRTGDSSSSGTTEVITKEQAVAILQELREIRQLLAQQVQLLGNPSSHVPLPDRTQIQVRQGWHSIGAANATVTIVEFTDLECPYCRRFHTDVFPLLKQAYIDTGKARFVSLDMPMEFHRFARMAAEAARCGEDQGKFWELRDVVLAHNTPPTLDHIVELAQALGMDLRAFRSCLESGKYQATVQQDFADAIATGINATPSFVIAPTAKDVLSGVLLVGARSFADFQLLIDNVLNRHAERASAPSPPSE